MAAPGSAVQEGRTSLGAADVTDAQLAAMVAEQLGTDRVDVLTCAVSVAEYDIETLTTAARHWVRGTARHAGGTSSYAFFVKVVQSWRRSPAFAYVPEHMREIAAAGLPWRTEPLVYRSDLASHLPPGLSMPAAFAVVDLDEESAALWLAGVDDVDSSAWDVDTFERAAQALGRFAARAAMVPIRTIGSHDVVHGYVHGRIQHQIAPALRNPELWAHPLVAETFDAQLRQRILAALDAVPRFLAELDTVAVGTAHGDACPRNMLRSDAVPDDFVLIDFNFLCEAPLGFDLSQLLLGEVQLGERPASQLPELEERCLAAYLTGLRAEGCDAELQEVRRAHALAMLLFAGLTAPPLEVLFGMPPPGGPELVRERAEAARFVLDLVDGTVPLL